MRFFSFQNIDLAGFIVSILCAIHCAAFPVLISMGLLSTTFIEGHVLFEWTIIGLSAIIASWSILRSYKKKHNSIWPVILVVSGFLFLGLAHGLHLSSWILVIGGLLVATAHVLNWKLLHSN